MELAQANEVRPQGSLHGVRQHRTAVALFGPRGVVAGAECFTETMEKHALLGRWAVVDADRRAWRDSIYGR